jgi:glycosyltransferase involved in cell wall biosynthesis
VENVEVGDLHRAWSSFLARPASERRRLARLVITEARLHGVRAALARVRAGGQSAGRGDAYARWCAAHTPGRAELARMRAEVDRFSYRPRLSIITPVYNTDARWLEACADSVVAQVYADWQWSIGNDGSTNPGTRTALERIAARDPRIVVTNAAANGGISAASNLALSKATGDYVALMDSDDALLPHALFRLAEALNAPGERPDVIYTDEDKLDLDGRRCDVYFKPDWSPDLFLSNMYVCHLLAARRALVHEVGGFRTAFDFSQDYDLVLRLVERANRVHHVPDVVYHWRKLPESGAAKSNAKPTAHLAGRRALQDYLDRNHRPGEIVDAGTPGFYRARYRLDRRPLVSIVGAAARDRPAAPTSYEPVEWVSEAADAEGEFLLFLASGATPAHPDWIDSLIEVAAQPGVGVVGPRVVSPDGLVREAGLVLGVGGTAAALLAGAPANGGGYFGSGITIRNVSAVSGTCFITARDLFDEHGGLNRRLGPDAQAIDYCLRVRGAGRRVVATPWARVVDGRPVRVPALSASDEASLRQTWGDRLARDPYYNVHLSTGAADYRIGV